jgi:hypothetical protein
MARPLPREDNNERCVLTSMTRAGFESAILVFARFQSVRINTLRPLWLSLCRI